MILNMAFTLTEALRASWTVLLHEHLGGAVDVVVGDHCLNLEPRYFIGLSTEFTPAEFDCLRLAIVGTGVNVLSHLNAMPLAPN